MNSWWRGVRVTRALRRVIRERGALRQRPWEEDLLHWAQDGTLHGTLVPPADGRRRSTTADGWCPGLGVDPRPGLATPEAPAT